MASFYVLTDEGNKAADKLTGEYFKKVREYLQALSSIKTESTSSLNAQLTRSLNGDICGT